MVGVGAAGATAAFQLGQPWRGEAGGQNGRGHGWPLGCEGLFASENNLLTAVCIADLGPNLMVFPCSLLRPREGLWPDGDCRAGPCHFVAIY